MQCPSTHLRFTLPGSLLLLSSLSCMVGPGYQRPEQAVPASWGQAAGATTRASRTTTRPIAITQWWATFSDPVLDSLIDRAVRANLDLRQARTRVLEARAQRVVAGAALDPSLDADASYQHTRISKNGVAGFGGGGSSAGSISANPQPGQAGRGAFPGGAFPSEFDLWQAGFDASWEIDLFGGARRQIEAATADLQASVENQRDVLLTVLAEVARNYVELRGVQRQLDIARANLQIQRDTLEITRDRAKNGLTTQLDVSRAISLVATTAATLPSLEAAQRQSIDRLALLLGQLPGELDGELSRAAPVPAAPPEVPVGLPSELLRRRPDVRRAERELAATTARIGVATADLFPRFSLTGAAGLQSLDVGNLLDSSSRFYSLGPSVRWHVFDFGRVRANIVVQEARQQRALAAYQKTVLSALQDVHGALVNYANEQDRRQSLRQAVDADRTSLELARQQYRQGVADFLAVLDAQRNLLTSEDALARSDEAVSANLVSLYKALGGGWEIQGGEVNR